ncbi:hypothetical protein GUJ93_ZPchr0010g10370 [Zizania palustris]|uniref:Uncharacterized protein n=1 Tax=Zizania palustris TaxID=103762 RepID=A0A8J5WAI7_ZIZPA|nr:hypothetical protein GUJ93_ZPchr0010g10370 [Zizania palustris]
MNSIRSALARAILSPNPRLLWARHYAASAGGTQPESVAAEMVRYALGGDRPRSSPEEAMRILEQGASNLQGGGEGSAEAVGMIMLAMSTLLYRSGRRQDAMEKLKATQQVAPSAAFRVAAWEATMGLSMEAYQDINTSVSPDDLVDLSIKDDNMKWSNQDHLKSRVNAIKGLIALINGETESALFFDGYKDPFAGVGNEHTENAVLSYGEYLHCVGDYPLATQMKFSEAEDYLTRALKKAEEQFGVSRLMDWRDIISLARGEYAELLLVQSNRKAEGERMKEWAEDAWRNRRLSLAQALEFSRPSKLTVVDTRIGRVI